MRVKRYVTVSVATVWTDPAKVRPIDTPAIAAPADPAAWSARLGTPERLDLHGRVVTQALLGDPVLVQEERDGWARVVLPEQATELDPRGYPGWIPCAQLAGTPPVGSPPLLPPGVAGPGPGADVPAVARLFLGVPYLWSGTSGYGVDCSGLTHLVHRYLGIWIPRDAGDQSRVGIPVDPAAAQPGDLLFFANDGGVHHVTIALGDGTMLHAPRAGSVVSIAAAADAAYDGETVTARRNSPPSTAR